MYQKDQFDLLILDIEMPRLNGLEVTKWIRNKSKDHGIPILIFSASGREEMQASLEAGANDYLFKIHEFGALYEKIVTLLPSHARGEHDVSGCHDTFASKEFNNSKKIISTITLEKISPTTERLIEHLDAHYYSLKESLCALDQALGKKQTQDLSRLIHRLKTSTGILEITPLEKRILAWEQEWGLDNVDKDKWQTKIREIVFLVQRAVEELTLEREELRRKS